MKYYDSLSPEQKESFDRSIEEVKAVNARIRGEEAAAPAKFWTIERRMAIIFQLAAFAEMIIKSGYLADNDVRGRAYEAAYMIKLLSNKLLPAEFFEANREKFVQALGPQEWAIIEGMKNGGQ